MKLDKKLHETHAKRLAAILNSQSTFAPHLNRPEFVTLLKLELNTLAAIEKILPDDKLDKNLSATHLLKEFNTLTKSEFKLGEKFKYEDNDDLIDNVNYLPTYCKNIFKVNIDDVVEGKKVTASNPNIDLRSKPEPGDEPMMDAASAFNMGAMGYAGGPYDNPFLMGKAYGRLNKDIAEGRVYQFKTKPRIIVICKYILTVLLSLSLISLIATSIFCFMASPMQVLYNGAEKSQSLNCYFSGIFYLITLGFGVYTLYINLKSLVKRKGKINENALYQFSWYFYLSYIILALLITLLDLRATWFYQNLFTPQETNTLARFGFDAWGIGIIVTAAIAGLCLVPMILGAVNAPKQDKDKLDSLLKQYVDEVMPTGPSAHADVQKPVDVKPSAPKKDNKEDKKESSDTKHKS